MGKQFEVYKKEGCNINPDCYRVFYNNCFVMSFGNIDNENNRIDVCTEMNIDSNQFKEFFVSMINAAHQYSEQTGEDLFQEILKELDEGEEE